MILADYLLIVAMIALGICVYVGERRYKLLLKTQHQLDDIRQAYTHNAEYTDELENVVFYPMVGQRILSCGLEISLKQRANHEKMKYDKQVGQPHFNFEEE